MPPLSPLRFVILDAFADHGEMHGHQLLAALATGPAATLLPTSPGATYGMLRRLEQDQLVAHRRTERPGNYPERQIFAITNTGRQERDRLRARGLTEISLGTDSFDVILASLPLPLEHAHRVAIATRIESLRTSLAVAKRGLSSADSYHVRAAQSHRVRRLQLDIDWLDELLS